MAKITKKEINMIKAANRYLRQHNISDLNNEAYLIAEAMTMETESFIGYSFYDKEGQKTSRDLAAYVQLNTKV